MANQDLKPLIGIIGGKGKMGTLFANFFRDHGLEVIISDKDNNPTAKESTNRELTNQEVAQKADIVIVSVPIPFASQVISEIAPHVRPESLLADFTGVKIEPVQAMLQSQAEVLGIHPMFGDTNPIPGQTIILCPARGEKWHPWVHNFLETAGAKVVTMTPEEHDKMMSLVQALVHFADISFAHTLKDLNVDITKFLKFASPASEQKLAFASRLLAQCPILYGSMQMFNPSNDEAFQSYLENVQKLIDINETKDLAKFKEYFNQAADYLGDYKNRALKETSWIIDTVLENREKRTTSTPSSTPTPTSTTPPTSQTHSPSTPPNTAPDSTPTFPIATLGPSNTHSSFTTKDYLQLTSPNSQIEPKYCNSIEEVFKLVANKQAEKGIVPIENILNGTVRETIDSLLKYDVTITEELHRPIHHCLAGPKKIDYSHMTTVISHPQALNQCRDFISKNCPHLEKKSAASTAKAMEQVATENDPSLLAIGPKEAAQALNLEIIAENIEDNPNNTTNFILIEPKKDPLPTSTDLPLTANYKTSVIFYFTKDQAGSLSEVLTELSSRKINLTKIESRPTKKEFGDYFFYLDFQGHISQSNIQEALQTIQTKVADLKLLGSYPY